jgi:predicted lysophospholipase L1 biosynthesis ABC-type transport system permease subunit
LWPGQEPIGRLFTRGDPSVRFEVVGVVVDGHMTALEAESPLMVYVPYWFTSEGKSLLLAKVSGDPGTALSGLRGVVREVDAEIAIGDARPLQHVLDAARGGRQHQAMLLVAFGAGALLIASVGVYAATSYSVSRRRREMNIRVALGASVKAVFGLVLRQTALPLGIGVAGGCAGALALGTVVASFLFEIGPRDPIVVTAASLLVACAGLLAAATAAHRGLRIDPVEALRGD